VNADRVLVTCGTHGGKPRCVMRDLGLLKSYKELPSLPHVATSSPYLKSLAKVHGKSGLWKNLGYTQTFALSYGCKMCAFVGVIGRGPGHGVLR